MKKMGICFVVMATLLLGGRVAMAQYGTLQSVLSQHTWFKLSVAEEGVYKLDYADLQSMGIDMGALDPNRIRLFGNPSGALPEKNSERRFDDLTELAIYVQGAADGTFDASDFVLFYGQEPTRWSIANTTKGYQYVRQRNYYSDTTYYYLCVDSGVDGLRVGEKASLPVEGNTTVITEFPDFWWHEEELFSPYSIGQNWFGESISLDDGQMVLPVVFPNLVKNKSLRVRSSVMGRCKDEAMRYSMTIGDNLLVDNGRISSYGNYEYGILSNVEKQVLLESDTALFTLSMGPSPSGSLLYLDYVEIFGWRQLKRVGTNFAFRLLPDQFGDGASSVWVQDVGDRHWLWDVSAPLAPQRQQGILSAGNFVFAIDGAEERRYLMFDPSAALPVASWTTVANQNLHAITQADMLVITSPLFMQQAQELASFHADRDGLNSVVVDVEEIYNEFSTGTCDPSGIRDFIRMVYQRSAGALKYVTLFGRPSFDFRNLKGHDRNFVPCYETGTAPQREESFGTDDFFAMMDDNEGSNADGRVDIGIGRLPVSTMAEAQAVMDKIRLYHDMAASHGDWKTQLLLLSDDENRQYVTQNENYCGILDSVVPALHATKVYCGAYPRKNTSTGVEIPQANAELVKAINDGLFYLCYTGHGGVKGLTGDNVFTVSDINSLRNQEKMPFVFTATCEFSKYDNPLLVSAGELLFLKPDGGAIAMLTACRPTAGTNNGKLGNALANELTRREADGRQQRLGDIVRKAKSNPANFTTTSNRSLNISFLFFGDPAMRLAFPEEDVVALKINGKEAGLGEIAIGAMGMVTLEGEVRTADGTPDRNFNGEVSVRLYDRKSPIKVAFKNTVGGTEYFNYYHHKDVIHGGRASVENGRFNLTLQVPRDIDPQHGSPRFQFYAYDSIRQKEAIGKFDNLTLGGTDPSAVADNEGPQIDFYWNTPDFVNGSVVERQGTLRADLYDPQGIYHYDFSLGRNITLDSNLPALDNTVLNDRFVPALDDFRRGSIAIPVEDLPPGQYEFRLKAWDTQDNSSEATVWFTVGDGVFLSQVRNFPNPFSDETWFHFAHDGDDGDYHVNLEVFDMLGRHVAQLSQTVAITDGVMTPIHWNATDIEGKPLRAGLYLYRFTFTGANGQTRSVSQKMVVTQ